MGVRSLHHIAIRVRDPEASRRFYEDVLGFRFMEIPVSGAMITEWEDAPPLQGTGPNDRFNERRIGVDHLAFGVEGREDLERLERSLRDAGVDTAGIEHDPVLDKDYVAFRDPDNVQWEFYMAV